MKWIGNLRAWALDQCFIKQPQLRSFITRLLFGSANHEINLFGTHLLVNALRENGYYRAFKAARYRSLWRDEVSTLCALFTVLRPGDLFVDVGANIGVFACSVARIPGVQVAAFEANPDTFARLQINAARHGVKAVQVAVSDREGELEFCSGAVSHVFAAASHRNRYHYGDSIKVPTRSLDTLLNTPRPIILKIDVEGHEPQVLLGAAKLLGSGTIQGVILDASLETDKAAALLKEQGFVILDARNFLPRVAGSAVVLALAPERCKILGIESPEFLA